MHVMFRLSPVVGALLCAAAPLAAAESALPDPIAPAVIGRPLDQIRPVRPAHHQAGVSKGRRRAEVPAAQRVKRAGPRATVTMAPARHAPVSQHVAVRRAPVSQHVAMRRAPVSQPAAIQQAPVSPPVAIRSVPVSPSVAIQSAPVSPSVALRPAPLPPVAIVRDTPVQPQQHAATQAMGAAREARFSSQDEMLVRRYYDTHPAADHVVQWKIGEAIPPKAVLTGVPDDLRYALSPLPAGHQYVEVDGDVVMVAVQSRVVVDGISRGPR